MKALDSASRLQLSYIQDRLLLMKQLPHQVIRFLQHFLHHRQRILWKLSGFRKFSCLLLCLFSKNDSCWCILGKSMHSLILHLPINRGKTCMLLINLHLLLTSQRSLLRSLPQSYNLCSLQHLLPLRTLDGVVPSY